MPAKQRPLARVFYSWQSDLPNATNRGFIQKALDNVAKSIRADGSIEVEPVIDRDTQGVAGAADIVATILAKIDAADVFVSDVSIINLGAKERLMPNPNVLIELGYAVKKSGAKRIIMVMNTEYGNPENLPFDLRMKKVVTYSMPEDAEDRATARRQLEGALDRELRTMLADVERESSSAQSAIVDQTVLAIENAQPNKPALIRRFLNDLLKTLEDLAPESAKEKKDANFVASAISRATTGVVDFTRVIEAIALTNVGETTKELHRFFEVLANEYRLPKGFTGGFSDTDFDYYRFLGYELFVSTISFLIRENRWEMIAEFLDRDFFIESPYRGVSGPERFTCLDPDIRLFSCQELVIQRHTEGDLSNRVSMEAFIEADCFLFLRSEVEQSQPGQWLTWWPWSFSGVSNNLPRYLIEAKKKAFVYCSP